MAKKKKAKKVQPALDPIAEIKKMEAIKRKKVVNDAAKKMSFDEWWSLRRTVIPAMHKKEVIASNFVVWGLGDFELMADFDAALRKYGIEF